ncbi:hypothetical protein BGZ97_011816 [Linnemannia gamsii]|uniref:Uncharacterized protein n=1 Tax=Linnemannia gamsii TaxID=64522 RepID=A0A9P6R5C3_9FUNG|nr:hypothetical protein BGZ97_011816 [Linnemannia gamsii]
MASAPTQFFETSKLVIMTGEFLSDKDLSSYMSTCRALRTLCTPLLYRTLQLDTLTRHQKLPLSLEELEAWKRNINFIRSISLVHSVLDQYYPKELAVVAALATVTTIDRVLLELSDSLSPDTATSNEPATADLGGDLSQIKNETAITTASIPSITHSVIAPHAARMTLQPNNPIPGLLLPPLTNLTYFHYQYSAVEHPSFKTLDQNANVQVVQIVGLLRQSPHLKIIHLHDILVRDNMALEKFTRTLSVYTELKTLVLDIWAPDSWSDRVLAAVFFSCPESVKVLRIGLQSYIGESRRVAIAARTLEAPLLRQVPSLSNLAEFSLSGSYLPVMEDLLVMLEYIPNVTTLCLPRIRRPADVHLVGQIAVERCPNVRNLAQVSCWEDDSLSVLVPVFETAHFYNRECVLTLEDATVFPWASTRLTSLGLVIDLGEMYVPDLDWEDLTQEEQATLTLLDAFYSQIGVLTSMRKLTLQVLIGSEEEYDKNDFYIETPAYRKRCFPGMLKLGAGMRSKNRGWLECLSGLNKLEYLHGSFNVAVGYEECLMGQDEAMWIARYWTSLKSADFLCEDDMLVLVIL